MQKAVRVPAHSWESPSTGRKEVSQAHPNARNAGALVPFWLEVLLHLQYTMQTGKIMYLDIISAREGGDWPDEN